MSEVGGKKINAALGVQIIIPKEYQGKGISSSAVVEIKAMCVKMGIRKLIILIRPTLKSKYPITDIDNYSNWKNEKGFPFGRYSPLNTGSRFSRRAVNAS